MHKPHQAVSLARRTPLREASRAGRFAKRWYLSRPAAARPGPVEAAEPSRDPAPPVRKAG